MSLNPSASTARLSGISALAPEADTRRAPVGQSHIRRLLLDAHKIKAAIGLSGFVVLSVGFALAAVCTAWGVQTGVSYPVAIAAGYCMLGCSACVCAALTMVLNSSGVPHQVRDSGGPTYAAWQVVKTLRVSDASRLWCDIEPGCPATQESLAWAQAIFNAIKSGDLAVSEDAGSSKETMDRERINPNWATEVERGALKRWATSYGHSPRFLQG